jgi:hypothetical protein
MLKQTHLSEGDDERSRPETGATNPQAGIQRVLDPRQRELTHLHSMADGGMSLPASHAGEGSAAWPQLGPPQHLTMSAP